MAWTPRLRRVQLRASPVAAIATNYGTDYQQPYQRARHRGTQSAGRSDAARLLISDQAAWDVAPAPKFFDSCDSLRRYGVYMDTGATTSHPVPCSSWDHQPCAEKHAKKELETFIGLLAGAEVAFYATVPDADFVSGRFEQPSELLGRPGGSGLVPVGSEGRRKGVGDRLPASWWARRTSGSSENTYNPLKIAAVALRQPGVRRIDGSSVKRAKAELDERIEEAVGEDDESEMPGSESDDSNDEKAETEEGSGPKVKWFPASSYARWQRKNELAAEVAEDDHSGWM